MPCHPATRSSNSAHALAAAHGAPGPFSEAVQTACIEAAKRGSSVSRLLGEWLAEKMRQEDAYAQAMREALGFETWGASSGPYVPRDQLFLR